MELSLKSKWLGSRVCTGSYDVLTINSCHVETVCQLVGKKKGHKKKINYREEEVGDCGYIF